MSGRRQRWCGPLLVVLAIAAGLATVVAPPAGADVTSISPAVREVDPGGATTATVTVSSDIPTCVSARPSDARLSPSFTTTCDDEPTWRTTLTVQVPDEPGTYSVEVGDDRSNVTRRFELRVREPAPPPPPPTTTAPPVATTTPATTTTAPSTTSTSTPTTTTVAETTTTLAPPPPGGGFVPVATLVEAGVPSEGVFLPFSTGGYRTCLPLAEPCVDPASAVVLVPARTTELAWSRVAEGSPAPPPRLDLRGLSPLVPVGTSPAEPGASDYTLPVLDLSAQGGQLRTLLRGLDETGRFVTARVGSGAAVPKAEGPMAAPETETFLASAPFGRPRLATKDEFTEAAPAVALFASTELHVLYGLRPDPSWGLDVAFLPFFGERSVPYLVRGVDGPPGLYVARPTGLRIPQTGSRDVAADEPEDGGDGGLPAVALLGGAVGLGAIATGALAFRRRRRSA